MAAYRFWDEVWATTRGRECWSAPDPWVVDTAVAVRTSGGRDALDLGCGVGRHTKVLADLGFRTMGLDRSREAVTATHGTGCRSAVQGDQSDLPLRDDAVDLVLAYNVVYHADEEGLGRALAEIARVLRPGGHYVTTMLSKRNVAHGVGIEVSRNTFRQPDADDDKVHPHLYLDADDLVRLHTRFDLIDASDVEQQAPGSFHWHCRFAVRPARPS